ncbi:hypothetical protein AYO41_04390 [Verrucomicrobia bacterium SCGC AG-212-E04]|nr:hypothetical protein AYO41_04390 [Verrucomicrobia bacterium SCGC AG-212-E04]
MLAALVVHASRSPALGLFAYVLVLMDRAFFFIAYAHRMEFLALIALVPLVWIMVNRSSNRPSSVAAEVVATICSLAAPMFHPAAALAAGFILLVALRRAYVQKLSVRWSLTHLASYLLGAVTFASWLYLQPVVLEQFRDHAARAAATYPMGTLFIRAMPLFYAPTFTGVFVYGLGLVAAAFALSGAVRRLAPQSVIAPKMMTDLAAASLGSLLAFHILRNPYYTTLLLPLLLPLGMTFALGVWPLLPRVPKPLLIAVAVGFLTLHGAFWVTRSAKFSQDHFANLRAELDVFWATLPAGQQRLFVPEVLWEAAAKDSGRRVRTMMNTLPHAATLERRAAYEAYAYGMATKGDLLIVDAFQSNRILTEIDPALWEPVSRVSRPLPGKTPWGFELITYRRRQ